MGVQLRSSRAWRDAAKCEASPPMPEAMGLPNWSRIWTTPSLMLAASEGEPNGAALARRLSVARVDVDLQLVDVRLQLRDARGPGVVGRALAGAEGPRDLGGAGL